MGGQAPTSMVERVKPATQPYATRVHSAFPQSDRQLGQINNPIADRDLYLEIFAEGFDETCTVHSSRTPTFELCPSNSAEVLRCLWKGGLQLAFAQPGLAGSGPASVFFDRGIGQPVRSEGPRRKRTDGEGGGGVIQPGWHHELAVWCWEGVT